MSGLESIFKGKKTENLFAAALLDDFLPCYGSSELDIGGWDFLVQDMMKFGVAVHTEFVQSSDYRVQLKATSEITSGPTLTLQNLIDLVEQPSPAFVVNAEVTHELGALDVYHVGKDVIRKVVELKREAISDGVAFNRKTVTLPKKNGKRITRPYNFRQVFSELSAEFPAPYLENKLNFANNPDSGTLVAPSVIYDFSRPLDLSEVAPEDISPAGFSIKESSRRLYIDGLFPFRQDNFTFANPVQRVFWDNVPAFRLSDDFSIVDYEYREPFLHPVLRLRITKNSMQFIYETQTRTKLSTLVEITRAMRILAGPDAECFLERKDGTRLYFRNSTAMSLSYPDEFTDDTTRPIYEFASMLLHASKDRDMGLNLAVSVGDICRLLRQNNCFRLSASGNARVRLEHSVDRGRQPVDVVASFKVDGLSYFEVWRLWTQNKHRVSAGKFVEVYGGTLERHVLLDDPQKLALLGLGRLHPISAETWIPRDPRYLTQS